MKKVLRIVAPALLIVLAMVVLALAVSAQEVTVQLPAAGLDDHIVRVNALFSAYDVAPPYGTIGKQEIELLQAFFLEAAQGGYLPWLDFNNDGVIDVNDLAQVASRFECTFADACYW